MATVSITNFVTCRAPVAGAKAARASIYGKLVYGKQKGAPPRGGGMGASTAARTARGAAPPACASSWLLVWTLTSIGLPSFWPFSGL